MRNTNLDFDQWEWDHSICDFGSRELLDGKVRPLKGLLLSMTGELSVGYRNLRGLGVTSS